MGIAWIAARVAWRRRAGALLLLAVVVALAGGVTIAAAAGARRADTAFARFSDETGEPDIQADGFASPGSWSRASRPAAGGAFTAAAGLPGVLRGQRFAAVAVAATEDADAFAFAIVDEAGAPHRPFMIEGRMFDAGDPHEVVVNEAGADAFGVGVGDRLMLGTIGWDRLDEFLEQNAAFVERTGPAIEVTVTGIHRSAVDIAQQDDPFVTLSRAFVERYGEHVIHCACIDNFDATPGHEAEALAAVGRVYEPVGYEVDLEEGGALPEHVANGIDVEVAAMRLLAVAAGIAGLVVVAQAIARHAASTHAERAITTALGATTRQQTVAGVLALAPAIILGTVGALLLAIGSSALTPRGLARRAEIEPGVRIDWLVLTVGAVAILGVGAAILVVATRRSVRPRPWASPRFVALPSGVGAAGLLGIAMATRPAQRGRLAAGGAIVAMAMGVAGLLGVWSFEAGRQRLVSEGRLFGADADMAWRGTADEAEAAVAAARSSGEVAAVGVRWALETDLTLTGPGGTARGNPSALDAVMGWAGPTIVRGRTAAGPDEVALGGRVLAEVGIDLGAKVHVRGPSGVAELTVVGEVVAWGTDEVDDGIEVSMTGLHALSALSCEGRFGCEPSVQHVVARSGGAEVRADLAAAGFVPVPLPSEIGNLDEAGPVPWMLAAFLAALAVTGLLHAYVTVLRVRRRDVVIGQALGLTRAGARSAARWTASTMTIAGVLIGVPIGIVVGRLVWAGTARRLGVVVEHGLPWWAPVLTGLGALVATLALAEIPARRTARAPLTLRAE